MTACVRLNQFLKILKKDGSPIFSLFLKSFYLIPILIPILILILPSKSLFSSLPDGFRADSPNCSRHSLSSDN